MKKAEMKVYITPDLKKQFQIMAIEKDVSLSALIELILNDYKQKQ